MAQLVLPQHRRYNDRVGCVDCVLLMCQHFVFQRSRGHILHRRKRVHSQRKGAAPSASAQNLHGTTSHQSVPTISRSPSTLPQTSHLFPTPSSETTEKLQTSLKVHRPTSKTEQAPTPPFRDALRPFGRVTLEAVLKGHGSRRRGTKVKPRRVTLEGLPFKLP